jgi:hypothetical protein
MLGYAIAAPNLQNYGSQGRRGLTSKLFFILYKPGLTHESRKDELKRHRVMRV